MERKIVSPKAKQRTLEKSPSCEQHERGRGKYRIDWDSRVIVLKYVRKYEEYKAWLAEERKRIMEPGPAQMDGMPHGTTPGDMTAAAVEALEKLELHQRARIVRAITVAREQIGADIPDEKEKEKLRNAIWLSCQNGRKHNFDTFAGTVACERRQFYYYKNSFLLEIKKTLGI